MLRSRTCCAQDLTHRDISRSVGLCNHLFELVSGSRSTLLATGQLVLELSTQVEVVDDVLKATLAVPAVDVSIGAAGLRQLARVCQHLVSCVTDTIHFLESVNRCPVPSSVGLWCGEDDDLLSASYLGQKLVPAAVLQQLGSVKTILAEVNASVVDQCSAVARRQAAAKKDGSCASGVSVQLFSEAVLTVGTTVASARDTVQTLLQARTVVGAEPTIVERSLSSVLRTLDAAASSVSGLSSPSSDAAVDADCTISDFSTQLSRAVEDVLLSVQRFVKDMEAGAKGSCWGVVVKDETTPTAPAVAASGDGNTDDVEVSDAEDEDDYSVVDVVHEHGEPWVWSRLVFLGT